MGLVGCFRSYETSVPHLVAPAKYSLERVTATGLDRPFDWIWRPVPHPGICSTEGVHRAGHEGSAYFEYFPGQSMLEHIAPRVASLGNCEQGLVHPAWQVREVPEGCPIVACP